LDRPAGSRENEARGAWEVTAKKEIIPIHCVSTTDDSQQRIAHFNELDIFYVYFLALDPVRSGLI